MPHWGDYYIINPTLQAEMPNHAISLFKLSRVVQAFSSLLTLSFLAFFQGILGIPRLTRHLLDRLYIV